MSVVSAPAAALSDLFARTRLEGRAAFAAYLPAGYPSAEEGLDALLAVADHADLVEVGVPVQHAHLDGPVIQNAHRRSLDGGFEMGHLFEVLRHLTNHTAAAVLVMTYWAPVTRFGPDRFAQAVSHAGAAGVLIPDIPPDALEAWHRAAGRYSLDTVQVAPRHGDHHALKKACGQSTGLVYAPASHGVTGGSAVIDRRLHEFVAEIRQLTSTPVGVGFGISTAEQVRQAARFADAVLVGSAVVKRLGSGGADAAAALVRELASAVHT
ncbi:tryptophan synthase subunit alpha [Streptomyces sp. NPDC058548]|uniref:tryptophan synthase subunit alpha n=1 Tax=Streptomyces sp. NPDC058548 TaxID=3346545 RepID=UPI00365A8176